MAFVPRRVADARAPIRDPRRPRTSFYGVGLDEAMRGDQSYARGRGTGKDSKWHCADDWRRDSEASSMWRPGCQLFWPSCAPRTQTRKSRACISRSHGPTTTPTSPTAFFVSHFRDDPIALDAMARDEGKGLASSRRRLLFLSGRSLPRAAISRSASPMTTPVSPTGHQAGLPCYHFVSFSSPPRDKGQLGGGCGALWCQNQLTRERKSPIRERNGARQPHPDPRPHVLEGRAGPHSRPS